MQHPEDKVAEVTETWRATRDPLLTRSWLEDRSSSRQKG